MPGGAHLNATNYVYNVADADGLTILAANPELLDADITADWTLLEDQAALGYIDLIVKGTVDGQIRGLLYRPGLEDYVTDRTGLGPFTRAVRIVLTPRQKSSSDGWSSDSCQSGSVRPVAARSAVRSGRCRTKRSKLGGR